MNPSDECVRKDDERSTFDGVFFAVRYLQLEEREVLCLVAQDAQGNLLGTWPQPEKNLAELD